MEAVRHYIGVIQVNEELNAWLEVYADEAEVIANELDKEIKAGLPLKPLHGVVIGLKDVICYRGHTVSAASKILAEFTSIYNATVTQRLLEAGAIIIGRNNCDEFAMGSSNENSAFGPVKNAVDHSRVPGGSSGGSAVAVQAGMCMVSLGSDTGGSVRQPADFCGIVGLKPTYGAISRHGLIAYASSFDQIGIFGQSVDDVFSVLDVIGGPDDYDSTVQQLSKFGKELYAGIPSLARIAYFKNALEDPALDVEIRDAIMAFIKKLTAAGFSIEPIDFEYFDHIVPTYYVLTTAEASSNLSRYDGVKFGSRLETDETDLSNFYKINRSKGFGKEVKRRIMLGTFVLSAGYYDAYFTKAQQVRRLLSENTNSIFAEFDFIISPTVPTTAFKIGDSKNADPVEMFLADIYTVFANLVGIPSISIPLFSHSSGLPFGLQVMSSRGNELALQRLSKKFVEIK